MGKRAIVPERLKPIFDMAESFVSRFFQSKSEEPDEGKIQIGDERYILIRSASLSVEFFRIVQDLYMEKGEEEAINVARNFLFDISHAIGKSDAKSFHKRTGLDNSLKCLATGPIHFAYTGWGLVHILPESNPVPNEDFFLMYDHINSFEAESWLKNKLKPDFPVCFMNAGYSSGWCESSFDVNLVAVEIQCRAMGDERCRFIMAPPGKIAGYVEKYRIKTKGKPIRKYAVPGFFERKKIEERLVRSERKYRSLFESANDGILILSRALVMQVNTRGCDMLGLDVSDVIGKSVLTFSSRNQPGGISSEELWDAYSDKVLKGVPQVFPWQFKKANGLYMETEISLSLLDKRTGMLQAICRDISKRKELEQQLLQSQKMEAVGSLASGIAHDFNNILGGLLGYTALLKMNVGNTEKCMNYLARIEKTVQKAASLTNQLLTFTQQGKGSFIPLDINQHIRSVAELIDRTFKKKVTCSLQLMPTLKPVEGDPGQIEQVFLNLILNAAQAMPKGGQVSISTYMSSETPLVGLLRKSPTKCSQAVIVEIKDSGVGMDEETLRHIFEPYFSHRLNGTGTGLGLTIVYRIIENHGGAIQVSSQPGEGTLVTLLFPPTEKKLKKMLAAKKEMIRGRGRILVVDDEQVIRDLLDEILRGLGYEVIVAEDGFKALEILEKESSAIDLILLDAGLPRMSGKETFYQISSKYPGVKVVIITGMNISEGKWLSMKKAGALSIIKKPFTAERLSEIIHEVLSEKKKESEE